MCRLALIIYAAVFLAACDGTAEKPILRPTPLPSAPPAPAPPEPPSTPVRTMMMGEEAKGTFTGGALRYDLTAPAGGWLMVTLTWDVWYTDSLLTLAIGSTEHKPTPPAWSPLQLRWQVTGGQTYQLFVGPGGTGWFYDVPFVLTTRLE